MDSHPGQASDSSPINVVLPTPEEKPPTATMVRVIRFNTSRSIPPPLALGLPGRRESVYAISIEAMARECEATEGAGESMSDDEETARAELLQSISEAIERHGAAARGDVSLEEASRAWVEAGFEDAEEVDDWLSARCFSARGAQSVERGGINQHTAPKPKR